MELLFKLPAGKPPFIGVVFENSEQAEVNKDLLGLKGAKFSIMITGSGGNTLSFRVMSENPLNVRNYDNVKVDPVAFKAWRVYSHLPINFSHVIMVHDQPVVVKIEKKLFVLLIYAFIAG